MSTRLAKHFNLSNFVLPRSYFFLPSALAIILFLSACTACGCAEDFALTGLGEPASPGTLKNPSQIMPSRPGLSPNNSENLITPSTISDTVPDIQYAPPSQSQSKDKPSPIFLRPRIEQSVISKPFTLRGAVEYAQQNYPNILKGKSQMRAADRNVTVQKITEYMPDSLLQYQELYASHNKLSQVFFGSPVFPAISGPAQDTSTLSPYLFSAAGVSLDWAPLDFGLHKARIQLAKRLAAQTHSTYAATELDVGLTTANAFLDSVISVEQVRAAQQNVRSFDSSGNVP
ncbi:MAG: TolC family protein [Candidatus Melainabacteria bacterium]|nr:TolC family protein [Candidatus Melainabacteria bacterium]